VKNSTYYNEAISGYPYNPQKAKELLTQAGYPNGFSTKITLPNQTLLRDTAQIIAEQLAKVGIRAEIRAIEEAAYPKYIGGWEQGMLLHPMGMVNGAASQIAANFVQDSRLAWVSCPLSTPMMYTNSSWKPVPPRRKPP